jgi:hypothetical protein
MDWNICIMFLTNKFKMITKNFSLNKEPLYLVCGVKYIVIDALYVNDIRQELSDLNVDEIFNEIRNKVFPYTDTPFVEYIPRKKTFTLNQIKRVNHNQLMSRDKSVLSSDSGVLIFINTLIFIDFVSKCDYDELVNSETELLNIDYWRSITKSYNLHDVAITVSPGINSGIDFDGSGLFKIE